MSFHSIPYHATIFMHKKTLAMKLFKHDKGFLFTFVIINHSKSDKALHKDNVVKF